MAVSVRKTLAVGLLVGLLGGFAPAAEPAEERLTPLPEKPEAPALELEDMDGRTHRLAEYRGQVVIVNFWATWCPPCRKELPSLQRIWEEYQDEGLVILGVNVGEGPDRIFAFTADYPVTFPLLLDRDSQAIENWSVRGLPTSFVIDKKGRMAYRAVGAREFDHPAIRSTLEGLLAP